MVAANRPAQAGEAQITLFEIYSNYNKPIDVKSGCIELNYYESILDNSVRLSATITDTGFRTVKGTGKDSASVEKDDINLTVGEKVHVKLIDGNQFPLNFVDDKQFRIEEVRNIDESTNKMLYTIDLFSKESIDNMKSNLWPVAKFEGEIPVSTETILKDVLKTPKKITTDRGLNSYTFIGHAEKPFYIIPTLAKKTVPADIPNASGVLAGYLFYETYDGFNFRSIDKLFMQKPKKKYIFNNLIRCESGEKPDGYDGKILDFYFDSSLNLSNLGNTGAMVQSRNQEFNRMKNTYKENTFDSTSQYSNPDILGGIERPKIPVIQDSVTRNFNALMSDDGILPRGFTLSQQIPLSQKPNFKMDEILRQSAMRYNSLFAIKLSVAIAGDMSLRAGDVIFCDFPELSDKKNTLVSQKKSGNYMIVDICHRITKNGCYTRMNLVRDSIYRKPPKM